MSVEAHSGMNTKKRERCFSVRRSTIILTCNDRRPVMEGSRIVTFAALALIGGSAASYAGPCTTQISDLEQRIRVAQAAAHRLHGLIDPEANGLLL